MKLIYHQNGLAFRWVEDSYTPQSGEVIFNNYATEVELKAAFSGYEAARAPLLKAEKLAEIKALLADTDYKCLKFADGALTAEEYAETKAQRATYRAAYNQIEAATTLDEINAVTY
jgi:hypothetical protein